MKSSFHQKDEHLPEAYNDLQTHYIENVQSNVNELNHGEMAKFLTNYMG